MQRGLFEEAPALIDAGKNWKNQTIWTKDNLHVLRGMNSATVDLIYLDPPFNSNRDYEGAVGTEAAESGFKDTWTWTDINQLDYERIKREGSDEWLIIKHASRCHSTSMASYLLMMSPRLKEMKRVLKPTGSIYLHCDPTASHYLKGLMDFIFGKTNFRNEIVWCYRFGAGGKKQFRRKHDNIFYYSIGSKWTFNKDDVSVPARSAWAGQSGIKNVVLTDWWDIPSINNKERTGYSTQKPIALLERVIRASSNEGETVLDPFCGCATACVAAERLGREWVGIDIGKMAFTLVKSRLANSDVSLNTNNVINRTDQLHRTDLGKLTSYKSKENKERLYGYQDGKCAGCDVRMGQRNLTVDHIVATSIGGTDHPSNLQLLCAACNSKKGKKSNEEFQKELIEDGILDKPKKRKV